MEESTVCTFIAWLLRVQHDLLLEEEGSHCQGSKGECDEQEDDQCPGFFSFSHCEKVTLLSEKCMTIAKD